MKGIVVNMNVHQVTSIAIRAGKILLTSGAEIYRVEDTINRICNAYNIRCDSFVLPTGIFITAYEDSGEVTTLVKRIKERTIDLKKIELVNSFSRSLKDSTPSDFVKAMELLNSIEQDKGYPFWIRLVSASVTAFVFVLIFNGNIREGIAAAIISSVIYSFKERVLQIGIFPYLGFFISGIIAGGMSLVITTLFEDLNIYKIIIGAIIILLPGMAMTNGIKDALYGDLTSSLNRISEAVFTVTAIGAGVALLLFMALR